MKNFITRAFPMQFMALAVAGAFAGTLVATVPVKSVAQPASEGRPSAEAAKGAEAIELAKGAPDKHVVVRGDTLWDISAKFLKNPWRWPDVWQLNKEQIRNPHLIYPGDVVYLDTSSGQPRLRLGKMVGGSGDMAVAQSIRLGPQARAESLDRSPIPTINAMAIEPFLNRPLVVSANQLQNAPRIMATMEGRVYLGTNDYGYVRGLTSNETDWHVYRNAKPVIDPDTRQVLGYEAEFIATGRIESNSDPAKLRLTSVKEEVGKGDRLLPVDRARVLTYAPRPFDKAATGKILSIYRGVNQAGKNNVVSVNLGTEQGLEVGHVLMIQSTGARVLDRESPKRNDVVKLPNETIGHMLIFRVFDRIAYGLVMDSDNNVAIGSTVRSPSTR